MLRWFKSLFSRNTLEDKITSLNSELLKAIQENNYKLAFTLQEKITKLYDKCKSTPKI